MKTTTPAAYLIITRTNGIKDALNYSLCLGKGTAYFEADDEKDVIQPITEEQHNELKKMGIKGSIVVKTNILNNDDIKDSLVFYHSTFGEDPIIVSNTYQKIIGVLSGVVALDLYTTKCMNGEYSQSIHSMVSKATLTQLQINISDRLGCSISDLPKWATLVHMVDKRWCIVESDGYYITQEPMTKNPLDLIFD